MIWVLGPGRCLELGQGNTVGDFSHLSPGAPISWLMPMVRGAVESGLATLTINGTEIPTEVAHAFLSSVELAMDNSPTLGGHE